MLELEAELGCNSHLVAHRRQRFADHFFHRREDRRGGVIGDVALVLGLGFAGLVGAGRSEIAKAISGLEKSPSQEIFFDGKKICIGRPRDAINNGIFLAPENRRTEGLVMQMNVRENISLPSLENFSRYGLINGRHERKIAAEQVVRSS